MARFTYTARDEHGVLVRSAVEAESRHQALATLRTRELTALELQEELAAGGRSATGAPRARRWRGLGTTRVTVGQKAAFCRQLSISVNAGVSLREALESYAADEDHPSFRRVVEDIVVQLHAGKNFSDALASHVRLFSPLFVALIRAAEESGSLPATLEELANSLERSERLANRIRSITAYPMFVAIFFTIVCLVMTLFVVPKFQNIFAGFHTKLPLITRVVFGANRFFVEHLILFAFGAFVAVAACVLYARSGAGRRQVDRMKLRIPFFGMCMRKFAVSRFCRNLAIMLRGGVPVATAMEMSAATSGNLELEKAFLAARDRIVAGSSIAASLERDRTFPRLVVRMVNVGESSGRLPVVLEKVADLYDDQVEASIMVATSLFEPLVICLFGAVVLVLVMAIYYPVFTVAAHAT